MSPVPIWSISNSNHNLYYKFFFAQHDISSMSCNLSISKYQNTFSSRTAEICNHIIIREIKWIIFRLSLWKEKQEKKRIRIQERSKVHFTMVKQMSSQNAVRIFSEMELSVVNFISTSMWYISHMTSITHWHVDIPWKLLIGRNRTVWRETEGEKNSDLGKVCVI